MYLSQDMRSGSEINNGLDTQTNIISDISLKNNLTYTNTVSDTEPSRAPLNKVSDTEPSRSLLNTVSDTEPSRALPNSVYDTKPSSSPDSPHNPVSNFEPSQPLVSNVDHNINPVTLSYTGSDVESRSTPGSPRFSNLLTKDPLNPGVVFYQDIPRWEEESFPQYFPRY